MPSYPTDKVRTPGTVYGAAERRSTGRRKRIGPAELAGWLEERASRLGELWWEEIRSRGSGVGADVNGVVERFVDELVAMLPLLLGPKRELILPLWTRTAELFGTVAAKRGLAAGEVIEEFHLLRELVIRDLYRDPPLDGRLPLSLREILRLSRALDRAVTHASVGHTDAMFFQFFEVDRDSDLPAPDIAAEACAQLDLIHEELGLILSHSPDGTGKAATGE